MMLMLSSFHTLTLSFAVIDIKLSRRMRRLRECVNTAGSDSFSLIVVTTSSSCLTSQWHTLLRSRVSLRGQYDEIFVVHEISELLQNSLTS